MRRWGVYNPGGELVSKHWWYRTAFWAARGHSLTEGGGLWIARRIR